MNKRPFPLLLLILDGVGVYFDNPGNAVSMARTPNLERLWNVYPHGYLKASEEFVGLPSGTKGNSEVGHTNIGSGGIVYQSLLRINNAIALGALDTNSTIDKLIANAKNTKGNIHLMGLISDGGVHSHINHFVKIVEIIASKTTNISVYIHCFTDGRDSEPKGASQYFENLEAKLQKLGLGKIATVVGRYWAMDRDNRWNRVKKAYDLLVNGIGEKAESWKECLDKAYKKVESDEFIEPFIIDADSRIRKGDSVLFLNFRADRAVELTKSFVDPVFDGFSRSYLGDKILFASMMSYQKELDEFTELVFPRNSITLPFGRVIAERGLTQLRIAESEKYPHVTYFFNGGQNLKYLGEDRINIASPADVLTYDEKPEMSIIAVTNTVMDAIKRKKHDVIIMNYANGDMVAHTGNIEATIKAIEYVDYCVGQLVKLVIGMGGAIVITADHGNAEELINIDTGEIDTEHSIFPVPFLVVQKGLSSRVLPLGKLADIAPTMLSMLNIQVPVSMTGINLLKS